MRLKNLIADIPGLDPGSADLSLEISGLTSDSREVRPGMLFAALPGLKADGRDFIAAAAAAGAACVLVPEGTRAGVPALLARDAHSAFARMAANFYERQVPVTAAVTGTNGKTSTVHFCRQLWAALGHPAACMGTMGVTGPGFDKPGRLTTPDPVALFSGIAEVAKAGVTHLALEASSQGLHQRRLDGLKISAAAFTNLTRDHLDYHGTMEAYLESKLVLFRELLPSGGVAVVNDDSDSAPAVRAACKARGIRVLGYGVGGTDIRLLSRRPLPEGQAVSVEVMGARHETEIALVGAFQAANILCALGLVLAENPDDAGLRARALAALRELSSVRGRLELAALHPSGAAVYVDYAHTPDGLETMLKALRPHATGKLIAVFGCGGDRDRGKRPLMGEIAARLADVAIVTDDNPRTEDAAFVRSEIMKGAPGATEIPGRREAIRTAVKTLKPGDVLVLAGKGHEQGQIVGKETLPFDDAEEARSAVKELE